jgi:hypothetical protein
MLEKIAVPGSDGRRKERLPALRPPLIRSSSLSVHASANPVRVSWVVRTSANREFFARFLLDTHYPFKRRSSRHSDTSRIQDNSRLFSHLIFSTRHLNATLSTRHSKAKIQPVLHSLFFPSVLRIRGVGSANGNRTRISALKGPRANRCTIAPNNSYDRRERLSGKATSLTSYRSFGPLSQVHDLDAKPRFNDCSADRPQDQDMVRPGGCLEDIAFCSLLIQPIDLRYYITITEAAVPRCYSDGAS